MTNSDSQPLHSDRAATILVIFSMMIVSALGAWQLFGSPSRSSELRTAEPEASSVDLSTNPNDNDARDTITERPPRVRRVRFSQATIRLHQRGRFTETEPTETVMASRTNQTKERGPIADSETALASETGDATKSIAVPQSVAATVPDAVPEPVAVTAPDAVPQPVAITEPNRDDEPADSVMPAEEIESAAVDSLPVVEEPKETEGTTKGDIDLNESDKSSVAETKTEPDETEGLTEEDSVEDETEQSTTTQNDIASEKRVVAPELTILHRDSDSTTIRTTISLVVDGSIRSIQPGGEIRLPGSGPWSIRFLRKNRYVSDLQSVVPGSYYVERVGKTWHLQPNEKTETRDTTSDDDPDLDGESNLTARKPGTDPLQAN